MLIIALLTSLLTSLLTLVSWSRSGFCWALQVAIRLFWFTKSRSQVPMCGHGFTCVPPKCRPEFRKTSFAQIANHLFRGHFGSSFFCVAYLASLVSCGCACCGNASAPAWRKLARCATVTRGSVSGPRCACKCKQKRNCISASIVRAMVAKK